MWEYEYDGLQINQVNFPEYLNSMGKNGWELVFASGDFVNEKQVRLIWKRPKGVWKQPKDGQVERCGKS